VITGSAELRISGSGSPGASWRRVAEVADEELAGAGYVLVDGAAPGLRGALTATHRRDPTVQLIVVVPAEERAAAERTLLFTPGLGEVWLVTPAEVDEELRARAARVTGQRRDYRRTHRRVQHALGDLSGPSEARALVSDSFLAALLEVLPDLVVAVDSDDRVISANHAAERLLGRTEAELEGRPLAELLPADDPGALEKLLEDGRRAPSEGEVVFRHRAATVVAEVTVAPVLAGPPGVRCVVVYDVTEERRIRGELQRQAQVLEEQAAYLEEQTAEYEMVNQELHERTAELETAIEGRSRFYAGMSHELRTPLNAIIGYNALLLDGVLGEIPDFVATHLGKAQNASLHLLDLVNDVLDLAKIEAGRIEVNPEEVEIGALIAELLDTVRPLAGERGTELEVADAPPLSLHSDPRRVRQVVLNLLSNAIKYGEGRPVRVSWGEREGGRVEIAIADHGPGLTAEQIERVFDEFVQFDTAGGGTGLGLTISRRLAEVLGGRLELESEVGAGSTFRLVLPRG
jgi:PAS domain S-box-containing protein